MCVLNGAEFFGKTFYRTKMARVVVIYKNNTQFGNRDSDQNFRSRYSSVWWLHNPEK